MSQLSSISSQVDISDGSNYSPGPRHGSLSPAVSFNTEITNHSSTKSPSVGSPTDRHQTIPKPGPNATNDSTSSTPSASELAGPLNSLPVSHPSQQPPTNSRKMPASTLKEKNQLVLNSMVMSHKSKKRKTKAGNNVYVLNPQIAKAAQDYIKSGNIDSDVAKFEEEEDEEEDTTGFESDDESIKKQPTALTRAGRIHLLIGVSSKSDITTIYDEIRAVAAKFGWKLEQAFSEFMDLQKRIVYVMHRIFSQFYDWPREAMKLMLVQICEVSARNLAAKRRRLDKKKEERLRRSETLAKSKNTSGTYMHSSRVAKKVSDNGNRIGLSKDISSMSSVSQASQSGTGESQDTVIDEDLFKEQIGAFNGKVENDYTIESMDVDNHTTSSDDYRPIDIKRQHVITHDGHIENSRRSPTQGTQHIGQTNIQAVGTGTSETNSVILPLIGNENTKAGSTTVYTPVVEPSVMPHVPANETRGDTPMVELAESQSQYNHANTETPVAARETKGILEKDETLEQSMHMDDKTSASPKEVNSTATDIRVWIEGVEGHILLTDPLCSALPFFFYTIGMHVEMVSSSRLWGRPRSSTVGEFVCISTDADLKGLLSESRDVSIVIGTRDGYDRPSIMTGAETCTIEFGNNQHDSSEVTDNGVVRTEDNLVETQAPVRPDCDDALGNCSHAPVEQGSVLDSSLFQLSDVRFRDMESPFSDLSEPDSDIDLDLEFSRLEKNNASNDLKKDSMMDTDRNDLIPDIMTAVETSRPNDNGDTAPVSKKEHHPVANINTDPVDDSEHTMAAASSNSPAATKKRSRKPREPSSKTKAVSTSSANNPGCVGARRAQRASRYTGSFKE